jgi:hypothetical protein
MRDSALAAVLADLDRCEHGRHKGDICSGKMPGGCGGPSHGNPHMEEGEVIGYGIGGYDDPIVFPGRTLKMDAREWRPTYHTPRFYVE